MKCRTLLSGLLVLVWASWVGFALAQEPTTGSIEGTVTDPGGQPLAGVTVTITSAQGAKTVTTDTIGHFRLPYLTPTIYGLTAAMHGYTTAERQNIEVRLGARVRMEVILTPGVSEKIEVISTAPVVDLSSTTTGATISAALMSSIPLGRSFSNTLALAPGVVEGGIDNANPSIAGSSGLENTYVVDGMSIGNTGYGSAGSYSIIYGSMGTGVNYDYIQEVQVKTGGYEPEYGEALGGFVNLITKSGGNTFTGSVFTYQQFSGLESERTRTTRLNASYDATGFGSRDYGFEAGGPVAKDKAFWFAAFDPTFTTRTRRTAQAITTAQGIDHTVDVDRTIYNYAANLKWLVSPSTTLTISAFGDPSVGANGPQRTDAVAVADPKTKYSKLEYGGNNVVGHLNAELFNNFFAEYTRAFHQDVFKETPGMNLPQGINRATESGVPERFGGVGYFENATSRNEQESLKLSNYLHAAGEHNLRYGYIHQDISYVETPNYSGRSGIDIQLDPNDPSSIVTSSSGYSWDINASASRFRINRIRSGSLGAETRTNYLAGFVSDTWNPTKYLSIMAGIRYEQEKLMGNVTDFTWDNNWSPRFHVTLDPTMDNKSKISFAYGRFFGKVPNDLAVRALSQETTYQVYYDLDAVTAATTDWNNPQGLIPENQTSSPPYIFGNTQTVIDPKCKLSYLDEFVVGAEREVIPFLNVGVSFMHRQLGRTLEDTGDASYSDLIANSDLSVNYIIRNPGPENGNPKPTRNYDALTLKVEKRIHNDWQMLASYTYSKLRGNYEGYFRRDNGQSDPFVTSAFDFPYLSDPDVWKYTIADDGPLPSDRPHVLSVYGSYRFSIDLNLGLSLKVQSGTPITKLGFNEVYGNGGEIVLEPRGASGRGATMSDVGVHLDYPIALGMDGKTLEVSLDVFNLLDQQEGVTYEYDYELGGTVDPVARLLEPPYNLEACPDCVNPDFGKPVDYQDPRQIVLALRARF
jgi:hypothetical protein